VLSWNFLTDELDSEALFIDCRSDEHYAKSTIEGAYGASFIKKPYGSGPQSMQKLSGYVKHITGLAEKKSSIICFDEGEGMYASRMTWLLQAAGYANAKMLALRFQDVPAKALKPGKNQMECEPSPDNVNWKGLASIGFLQQNLTRVQLLDVRTQDEYEGRIPRMTPEPGGICGRIPGSINWDWRTLYDTDGHIRGKMSVLGDIRQIGLIQERPTVIYDFNGARSCTTALVLSRCGYRQVQVYMGSWVEWRKSKLPKQNVRTFGGEALV